MSEKEFVHVEVEPNKQEAYAPDNTAKIICSRYVPIFESINIEDAPTSLQGIVYPQILDDAERKYLSAVIRPFRKNVAGIYKIRSCNSQRCRISISVSEHGCCDLPWFDDGTMYEGMREYRKYTIEELGL